MRSRRTSRRSLGRRKKPATARQRASPLGPPSGRKVDRAVPLARRSRSESALLDTNLGGKAAFVLASPDGAADPPRKRDACATLFAPTCKDG